MANNDVVDRNKILGSATQDYGFDKVLRGYDIKQVNEYISNLLTTNKNAGELFDQRYEELKNTKQMLEYELSQSKGQVEKLSFLRIYVYSEILYRHKRAVKVKTLTPLKLRNISQK